MGLLRYFGLALGLVVLGASPAPAVDATPAKLTVRVESSPGIDDVPRSLHLPVAVEGAQLTVGSSGLLVDAQGQHVVRVESVAPANCDGLQRRETGLEGMEWCLYLEGIEVGHEYSGTITPDLDVKRTALAITLTARHNFLVWPALVSLLAVVLGVLWAIWTGTKLKDLVSSNLLKAALARNRLADDQVVVDDLEGRIAALRAAGKSADDLRAMVLTIFRVGLERARDSRAKLGGAIIDFARAHSSWNDTVLLSAARNEQTRKDRFNDFFKDSGTPVEVHPADQWTANLQTVHSLLLQLELARRQVSGNPVLERQADLVEQTLRAATDDVGINLAKEHLARLWEDAFGPRDEAMVGAAPDSTEVRELRQLPSGAWLPLTKIGLALLVTILGLALIAVAGLLSGTYASNHTFGTHWDYLALSLAAFGSSAVAAIVAAFALTAVSKPK